MSGPKRGQRVAGSVLSLNSGAGPESKEDFVPPPRRPARPVRFDDPVKDAAYWARVDRIADAAPPLTDSQRAILRAQFHAPATREAA